MKKILAIIVAMLTVVMAAGTVLAKDVKADSVQWQHAGDLAPGLGFDKNIGIAGPMAGLSNGFVIVGGGANFPYDSVLNGGAKKTYPDVYSFKKDGNGLTQVDHIALPNEIGYGASVTAAAGVYYVGGSTNPEAAKAISLFTADQNGKIQVKQIGALPFAFQDGVAALYQDSLYIGLGKQDGKASNKFYRYDLKTNKTVELASFPGEPRTQAIAQILSGKLYAFSGGNAIAYTDGYRYDFAKNVWTQAASVGIGGQEISLLGANSVKLNENEMMVIGGFNKGVYDHAVANLSSLKGDALAKFKAGYFGGELANFKWNQEILIYQANTNTWKTIGQVPFNVPCGEGLVLNGDKIYSINGEIKPGVRSNRIYVGTILPGLK